MNWHSFRQPTPIRIEEWSPLWADQFANEAARIRSLVDGLNLHHIGSTAVVDCPAKTIIDVMAVVADLEAYRAARDWLVHELGYASLGPYGVAGREDFLFRYDKAGHFHVSVFHAQSEHVANNLQFRDLLNADLTARQEYVGLKRALARATPDDHAAYNLGKSALIAKLLS